MAPSTTDSSTAIQAARGSLELTTAQGRSRELAVVARRVELRMRASVGSGHYTTLLATKTASGALRGTFALPIEVQCRGGLELTTAQGRSLELAVVACMVELRIGWRVDSYH